MHANTLRLLSIVALVPALAGGCSSGDKTQTASVKDVSTPLPLDPTQEVPVAEWWTNGRQLLHLDEDGYYKLYAANNRYHPAQEQGRWWRQSYATVWLEPYDQRPQEPTRIQLRREGELVVMYVRNFATMTALDEPPVVVEDRLFGRWMGGGGTLQLGTDLRYSYQPREAERVGPASLASQEGAWLVEDDLLVLKPDSAGQSPTLVRIRAEDETITLELAEGRLVRSPVMLQDG